MTASALSLIFSLVATAVAVFTFAREFSRQLPTVEFLVEHDESGQPLYKLSVSNPTHRLLILNYVEILSPAADKVQIQPAGVNLHGTVTRAYEDALSTSKRAKSVFLAVPAEQTRHLEIELSDDEDFEVDFRLHWSKGLPLPYRCFIARKVKLDSAQVKDRRLAADANAA